MYPQPDRLVRIEPKPERFEVTSFSDTSPQYMSTVGVEHVYHTDRKLGMSMKADVLVPNIVEYMTREIAKAIVQEALRMTDVGTPVAFSPCEVEIFRPDRGLEPPTVRVALIATFEYTR